MSRRLRFDQDRSHFVQFSARGSHLIPSNFATLALTVGGFGTQPR